MLCAEARRRQLERVGLYGFHCTSFQYGEADQFMLFPRKIRLKIAEENFARVAFRDSKQVSADVVSPEFEQVSGFRQSLGFCKQQNNDAFRQS